MGKSKLIIGIVLVLLGLFYLAMPQTVQSYNLDFGLTQMMQQALGILLLVVGVLLVWKRH